jgi:Na+/melibiose symporter-like transporter
MVFPVLDGLTLDFLNQHDDNNDDTTSKSDFGQERLWGAVSWAIANLIIGPSLDRWGFISLYLYAILSTAYVIVTIVVFTSSQQARQKRRGYTSVVALDTVATTAEDPDEYEDKDQLPIPGGLKRQKSHFVEDSDESTTQQINDNLPFRKLLRLVFATSFGSAFMLAIFCSSIGTAVVESLIFLYFEVLGSSFTLCALTVLLTVVFEIPIFHVAPKLLKTYGSTKMLLMACVCYMTRVVGYSMVPKGQPWWVLLFEPLHGITYACASLSSVDFVAQLVPEGYEASGQGMLSSFRGCGSVIGLLIGGYGEELLGPRIMYRVLAAIVTFGFGVLLVASFKESTVLESLTESNEGKESNLETTGEDEQSTVELVGTLSEDGL